MRENMKGLRSTNWQVKNGQEDVKNSIGNGKAKELMCITRGHELREGIAGGKGGTGLGGQREKIGTTVIT